MRIWSATKGLRRRGVDARRRDGRLRWGRRNGPALGRRDQESCGRPARAYLPGQPNCLHLRRQTARFGLARRHRPNLEHSVAQAAFKPIHVCSTVHGVAFSPDGTRLALGCDDTTIRLIDVATSQEVAALRGHADYVHAVAWSPDGTRLVSGSGDNTVRVWDSLSIQARARASQGQPAH